MAPPRPACTPPASLGAGRLIPFLAVCVALLGSAVDTSGQESSLRFQRLGRADGLPSETVADVIQDSAGFIWIATEGGLVRFDGYQFRTFQYDPEEAGSLPTNLVSSLLEDAQGRLWVGTNQGGVIRLDKTSGQFEAFPVPASGVARFYNSADGTLWGYLGGASLSSALVRFDESAGLFVPVGIPPDIPREKAGTDVVVDHESGIWYASRGGRLIRLTESGSFSEPVDLRGAAVRHFRTDAGRFAVLTDADEVILNPSGEERRLALPDGIGAERVLFVGRESVWLKTASQNLYVASTRPQVAGMISVAPMGSATISAPEVARVFEDSGGGIWISTVLGGLYRTHIRNTQFTHLSPEDLGLPHPRVVNLYTAPDGALWVSTLAGGITRLDADLRPSGSLPRGLQLPDARMVKSVALGQDAAIWIGTWGTGLYRAGSERENPVVQTLLPEAHRAFGREAIRVLLPREDGGVLVGSEHGLFRAMGGGQSPERFGPPALRDVAIWSIAEDGDHLLIGTFRAGLFRIDAKSGELVRRFRHAPDDPESVSSDDVSAVHVDAAGRLWVGTHGAGLNLIEPRTDRVRRWAVEDGLPDAFIHAILPDETGALWMSTYKGLSRLDPTTFEFENYAKADGLQDDVFGVAVAAHLPDGRLAFGGTNGITVFAPSALRPSDFDAPLVVSGQVVDGIRAGLPGYIDEGTSVSIPWREGQLEVEVAALDYAPEIRKSYRFFVDGYDRDWRAPSESRSISLSGLPPGSYTLRARATNGDGVWSSDELALPFEVVPPWWMTRWARVLAISLLFFLVGLTVRLVSTRAYRKRIQALHQERRIHEERTRISRDLHDNVGAQLNYVIASIDAEAEQADPDERDRLESLGERARETMTQLRDTIWAIQGDELSVGDFVGQVQGFADRLADYPDAPSVRISGEEMDQMTLTPAQGLGLYRIAQEALMNAFRHAQASRVDISASVNGSRLHFRVADDGAGMPEDAVIAGFGLQNMEARARELGGSWALTSSRGTGTTVEVRIELGGESPK